jgi:hypothetical protein
MWKLYIMRIIIYLASHDKAARNNNSNLFAIRDKVYHRQAFNISLDVRSNKLVQDPENHTDPFEHITPDKYQMVKIEFIAHGNPNYRDEILSLSLEAKAAALANQQKIKYSAGDKKESSATIADSTEIDITQEAARKMSLPSRRPVEVDEESGFTYDKMNAKILFDFFNENPKCKDAKTHEFKFGWLTLYACARLDFAETLSSYMPKVIITAYQHKITIDKRGDVYNEDGTPAQPTIFWNNQKNPPNVPEFEFEFQADTQAQENSLLWSAFGKPNTSRRAQPTTAVGSSLSSPSSPPTRPVNQQPQNSHSFLGHNRGPGQKSEQEGSPAASIPPGKKS